MKKDKRDHDNDSKQTAKTQAKSGRSNTDDGSTRETLQSFVANGVPAFLRQARYDLNRRGKSNWCEEIFKLTKLQPVTDACGKNKASILLILAHDDAGKFYSVTRRKIKPINIAQAFDIYTSILYDRTIFGKEVGGMNEVTKTCEGTGAFCNAIRTALTALAKNKKRPLIQFQATKATEKCLQRLAKETNRTIPSIVKELGDSGFQSLAEAWLSDIEEERRTPAEIAARPPLPHIIGLTHNPADSVFVSQALREFYAVHPEAMKASAPST